MSSTTAFEEAAKARTPGRNRQVTASKLNIESQMTADNNIMPSTFNHSPMLSSSIPPDSTAQLNPFSSSLGIDSTEVAPSPKRFHYAGGDSRNSSTPELRELKADMMCSWLHQQQLERMWSTNGLEEGVIIKKAKDEYKCAPEDLRSRPNGVFDAVKKLNVKVTLVI